MRERLTKELRRQTIFDNAVSLFLSEGYEHVTISDVISKSNIARGTFYLHFQSLEALLIEWFDGVTETAWTRIQPFLEDLTIPFDVCTRRVIHEMMALFADNPAMSNVFYCGGGETFMRRRHEALYGKLGSKLLQALIHRHPDVGPEISWTVTMLISLISDMAHIASQYIDAELLAEFEERVATFAAAGLGAHLDNPMHPSTYKPM